jgi:hypothetical protein
MRQLRASVLAFIVTGLLSVAACGSDDPPDPNDPNPPAPPATPTTLYALPGPDTDDIQLKWSTLTPGAKYNVYRSDAPGLTSATGTLVGDTPAPPGSDPDRPAGTYYYIVTAVRDGVESAASAEASIVFSPGFAITQLGITPLGAASSQLQVDLTIMSTLELTSATVQVADRSAPLTFIGGSGGGGAWRATLDLTGVAHGPLRLQIALTDAGGHAIETSIPFSYNTAPVLDLVAPGNYTVARPTLHVTATCTDDSGSCASFSIDLVDATLRPFKRILSITESSVDMDVPFALADVGQTPLVRFLVTDATGLADTVYRVLNTESPEATALQASVAVPGRVLDADADRVLYLDSTATDAQSFRIRDRATGADVTVSGVFRTLRAPAYLTPTGALFIQESPTTVQTLVEWRNGVATDLGLAQDLHVSGPYAIYVVGQDLIRLNTLTGASTVIATDAINIGNDVASNGDVAYWTNAGEVWLFREGTGAARISPVSEFSTNPATDGVNVVYARRVTTTPEGGTWELDRFDGTTTTVLAPERPQNFGYAVNNGWVAFTRAGSGGVLQVWTRSPAGEERQLTFRGTASNVAALGPGGEVVSANPYELHVPPYTGTPIALGAGSPTAFVFTGGVLLKLVGNTVFTVTP